MKNNYYYDESYPYLKTNREKRMTPKKAHRWCDGCDMYIVGEWQKCPLCGTRNGLKRLKKE